MPSWSIHLAVAKKVCKKFNFNKDIYYFANLIPDVDYNTKLSRKQTHYTNYVCKKCPKEYLPNIKEFLKTYNKNIKSSTLLIGYYTHLLTDYYYNDYIYSNCWIQDENNEVIGVKLNNGKIIYCDDLLKKEYKHHDLGLYGKYLYNNKMVELPKLDERIREELKVIDNLYSIEDIKRRIKYLNNDFIKLNKYSFLEKLFGLRYKLFTQDELDSLFNDCCIYVEKQLEKII